MAPAVAASAGFTGALGPAALADAVVRPSQPPCALAVDTTALVQSLSGPWSVRDQLARLRPAALAGTTAPAPGGLATAASVSAPAALVAVAAAWRAQRRTARYRRRGTPTARRATAVKVAAPATETPLAEGATVSSGAASTGSSTGDATVPAPTAPHEPATSAALAGQAPLLSDAWERALDGREGDVWTEPQVFQEILGPLNSGHGDETVGSIRFQQVSRRSGEGDLLLYVPGIDFAGVFAAPQFRRLAREGHELWRCYVGADDRTPFALMAKYVKDWVRARVASGRRVVLLGESFGGLLALEAALGLGSGLGGLVLVNPATSFGRTPWALLGRALAGVPVGTPMPPSTARSDAELLQEMNDRAAATPYAYLGSAALAGAIADPAQLTRVAARVATSMLDAQTSAAGSEQVGVNPTLQGFLTYPEQIAQLLPPETVRFRLRAWLRDGCEAVESQLRLGAPRRGVRARSFPPTLLVLSGGDRLLASGTEGQRLRPLLEPRCGRKNLQVVELGDKLGHAPLDNRTDLAALLRDSPICKPPQKPRDYVGSYEPPGLELLEEGSKSIESIAGIVSPVFCSRDPATGSRAFGLAGVPDPAEAGRPVIFVGNHQLLALDLGPLVREFLIEKGFAPRGLAHPINFPDVLSEMIAEMTPAPPLEGIGPLDAVGLPFELRAAARASLEAAQALASEREPKSSAAADGPPGLPFAPDGPGDGEADEEKKPEGGDGVGENFGFNGGFAKWGAVPVTPRNFIGLLSRGEAVLLFPGGAREACHRQTEKYQLFWPERTDFVRAAAKYNAIVVPFGGIGSADNLRFIPKDWGALEPFKGLVPPPFRGGGGAGDAGESSSPLAVQNGGLMPVSESLQASPSFPGVLPRFPPSGQTSPGFGDRFYYSFGEPVDLRDLDPKDRPGCDAAYAQLRSAVEGEIAWLLEARTRDPYRDFLKRRAFERVANLDRAPRRVRAGPLQGKEIRSCGRRAPSFEL